VGGYGGIPREGIGFDRDSLSPVRDKQDLSIEGGDRTEKQGKNEGEMRGKRGKLGSPKKLSYLDLGEDCGGGGGWVDRSPLSPTS
jgi:hypothetical protein